MVAFKLNMSYNVQHNVRFIFKVIAWFILFTPSYFSRALSQESLFGSDEVIKMELRADFAAIQRERGEEDPQDYLGELLYQSSDGNKTKLTVKVRSRGTFRRDPDNCSFPPLYLNFRKSELPQTLFQSQDKLKLVTPCQTEEDVIEEYLIYKMYNLVTDRSFNVRLAKVTFYDTGSEMELFEKYSFFLEDEEQLADRTGSFPDKAFVTPFDLDQEYYGKMSFFQYMIGNRDWYITSKKNVLILYPEDEISLPFAVPYDFDLSGFVDAEYSKPDGVPRNLLIDKRIYKGICYTVSEFDQILEFYLEMKPEFEALIEQEERLAKADRKRLINYIDHFYKVISNNDLLRSELLSVCETKELYNLQ